VKVTATHTADYLMNIRVIPSECGAFSSEGISTLFPSTASNSCAAD